MAKSLITVVLFFITLTLPKTVSALSCYVCNSGYENQTDCGDMIVPKKYEVKCDIRVHLSAPNNTDVDVEQYSVQNGNLTKDNYTYCRKVILTVEEQDNYSQYNKTAKERHRMKETKRTVRSCGFEEYRANYTGCKRRKSSVAVDYTCVCDKDLCNSAGRLFIKAGALLPIFFLTNVWPK